MNFRVPHRANIRSLKKFAISVFMSVAWLLISTPTLAATVSVNTDVIAGREVESLIVKSPAAKTCVVFENGLRATVESWSKVIDLLPESVAVFAYNRPGYGKSQEAAPPRDGGTIVEELRQVLKQKGLKPPYILVGHSLGGLYMQLFAKRHPNEVGGVVLVDSLFPGLVKKPEDFPFLTRSAKRLFFSNTVNNEIDLIYQTGAEVLSLAPIDDKPIVLLINKPKGSTAIPVDFGAFNLDRQTAASIRNLYPKAVRVVADSDHQMQSKDPKEVIQAINEVIAISLNGR